MKNIFTRRIALIFLAAVTLVVLLYTGNKTHAKNTKVLSQPALNNEILTESENETIKVPEFETKRVQPKTHHKLSKIEKFKKQIFNMGIADLSEDNEDEANKDTDVLEEETIISEDDDSVFDDEEIEVIAVHKKNNKKSKTTGYLVDGSTMTIIEQVGKWYKIKSGHIKGYVPTKNILVDNDVEDYLEENDYLNAKVIKGDTEVLSEAQKNCAAVGMGFNDQEYPIIQFSKNKKYVFVERTETISGWLPLSKVKIAITAPSAMTSKEYQEYKEELERKEQEELDRYLNANLSSSGNKLQDKIINLIAHNESGDFKNAHNRKFAAERTITVGAWQWYGENAHELLRLIIAGNAKKAKNIIEDAFSGEYAKDKAKKLYKDILGHTDWEKTKRKFSKNELIAIKQILGSPKGISIQKQKINTDIKSKINVGINTYHLKDDALTAYFCDMFWQSPNNARAVVKACFKHYKTAKKFCKDKNALKYMHATAIKNSVFKKYVKRRNYTYAYCKKLAS